MKAGSNWDNFENSINSLSNYMFVPYIAGYPLWMIFFLWRNRF